jgi:Zn-dependent protease
VLFFDLNPAQIVGIAVALVVGVTFHEFSHAFVADRLGDHRPRALGRVSLNPVRHIDPVGAIVFLLAGFGWGRPVPVNTYALRPGRIGLAMVAAGGPIANVLVALVAAVAYRVLEIAGVGGFALDLAYFVVLYNLLLGFFNLLPIPPLDGYNVVLAFAPPRAVFTIQRYAQYGVLLLLLLVLLPNSPLRYLFGLVAWLARLFVGT